VIGAHIVQYSAYIAVSFLYVHNTKHTMYKMLSIS